MMKTFHALLRSVRTFVVPVAVVMVGAPAVVSAAEPSPVSVVQVAVRDGVTDAVPVVMSRDVVPVEFRRAAVRDGVTDAVPVVMSRDVVPVEFRRVAFVS